MKPLYVVTVGGLLAILYLEWRVTPVMPPQIPGALATGPSSQKGSAASPLPTYRLRLDNRDHYDIISQRPLFSETRRPEEPEAAESPPVTAQKLDGLVLNAVLLRGTQHIALVKDLKSKETQRLAQGGQVRGWTVSAIRPDGIDLSFGDRTSQLELRIFTPPLVTTKGPKKARSASRWRRSARSVSRRSRRSSRYE